MTKALVIIHLSSLDAYTWSAGEDAGWNLSEALSFAIRDWKGPVFIVDQGWGYDGRQSKPRFDLLEFIKRRSKRLSKPIWIRFDENDPDGPDWDAFLEDLERRLKKLRVKSIMLGGLWWSKKGGGCVSHTYNYLRTRFKVKVDRELVGCEEEA